MDLNDYQAAALETDVRSKRETEDTVIHLLGLAGEAPVTLGCFVPRPRAAPALWSVRVPDGARTRGSPAFG